jgi:N utilization substance protein B
MSDGKDRKKTSNAKKTGSARAASRLAAVQALFQLEMSDISLRDTVTDFIENRLGDTIDDEEYVKADAVFFEDIVRGVVADQEVIDDHIRSALSENWSLSRIESVVRSILRSAIYELISRPDVPTNVIIYEYVDVAKAFYDDSKPGFVNGVLDKIGKKVRT